MKKFIITTLASPLLAAAAQGASPFTDLDLAARAYDRAQVQGDRQLLGILLADDYVLVNSGGEIETKTQFISDLTDPSYHLSPYNVVRPIDRRWSNGAVLGGVTHLKGTSSGKPFDVCLRFADIWAFRKGRWQVVYTQAARAGSEACR